MLIHQNNNSGKSASDFHARECAHLIQQSKSIVALTGAGISTSAGIPDFRGPQGLYVTRKYDAETIFDINYFLTDPKPFFDFARDFVGLERQVEPTLTHHFFSHLEAQGKIEGIITQNIDSLHQRAGSLNVLEMHGSFSESYCLECEKAFSYEDIKLKLFEEEIPRCPCRGVIKPDVVFFGENVRFLDEAYNLAEKADLFFVIGTSCIVYPAAMVPRLVTGKIVVVNLQPVAIPAANVAISIEGDIDEFFGEVVKYC